MVFEHTSAIETRRCHQRRLRFASRLTARSLCDWRELLCGAYDRRRSSDRFEARKAARPIDCARRRRRHFGRRACEHRDGNETVLNCKLHSCSAWCLFRVVPSDQTLFCFDRGGSRRIATESVSSAVGSIYCDAPKARLGREVRDIRDAGHEFAEQCVVPYLLPRKMREMASAARRAGRNTITQRSLTGRHFVTATLRAGVLLRKTGLSAVAVRAPFLVNSHHREGKTSLSSNGRRNRRYLFVVI